jgi:hypothetical protein
MNCRREDGKELFFRVEEEDKELGAVGWLCPCVQYMAIKQHDFLKKMATNHEIFCFICFQWYSSQTAKGLHYFLHSTMKKLYAST